jgi:uncharacterized SAM-binding protein YcdF (DUF218 family)
VYRFFADILQPFAVLYLAVAILLALQWRKRNATRRELRWLTLAFVPLTLLCLPVTAYFAIGSLEWPYPAQTERPPEAAIVVLSGWAFRPDGVRDQCLLGLDSQFRCLRAVELYRKTGPCPVYVTGGKVKPDDLGPTLARLMRDYLVEQGIAPADIVMEEESRNTFENARFSSKLLRAAGIREIVLVTTASHLPRAVRCFEATGLQVIPAGCEYQAANFNWAVVTFLPSPDGAAGVHRAFHEWVGIGLYWLRGYFSPAA